MYKNYLKRFFDFIFSFIGLVLLSPLILFLAVLLKVVNRDGPFFIHERPGKDEKKIRVIKFKSMNNARNAEGALLPDNERLTPLGAFIRKYSLDEIPQLINVLKGDMSLVGPRPLLFRYIPLYSMEQRKRHSVRPGITGWAQINGRNAIDWNQKFELDVYYVENLSFKLDLKILVTTIMKVIKREGINQSNARPMQPFTGNS